MTIALLVVAGFESSAFVGGVAFARCRLGCCPDPARRGRPADGGCALSADSPIAALLVVCLIAPFVRDQLAAIAARGGGRPIVVSPYRSVR